MLLPFLLDIISMAKFELQIFGDESTALMLRLPFTISITRYVSVSQLDLNIAKFVESLIECGY